MTNLPELWKLIHSENLTRSRVLNPKDHAFIHNCENVTRSRMLNPKDQGFIHNCAYIDPQIKQ